jgi:hypothetical protein
MEQTGLVIAHALHDHSGQCTATHKKSPFTRVLISLVVLSLSLLRGQLLPSQRTHVTTNLVVDRKLDHDLETMKYTYHPETVAAILRLLQSQQASPSTFPRNVISDTLTIPQVPFRLSRSWQNSEDFLLATDSRLLALGAESVNSLTRGVRYTVQRVHRLGYSRNSHNATTVKISKIFFRISVD